MEKLSHLKTIHVSVVRCLSAGQMFCRIWNGLQWNKFPKNYS